MWSNLLLKISSSEVYLTMCDFYERGIVRSTWLDRVIMILIKNGFGCVWGRERVIFRCKIIVSVSMLELILNTIFETVGTKKLKILMNVCLLQTQQNNLQRTFVVYRHIETIKENITCHFCLMSVFLPS